MKFLKLAAVAGAVILITVAGFAAWLYVSLTSQVEHRRTDTYITVDKGLAPDQIVDLLVREGVLDNSVAVKIYLRLSGFAEKLQAGDYKFKSPISAFEVVDELERGKLRTNKLTIPEGWTRFEIAKRIAANISSDPPMDEMAVLYLMNDTSLIKDIDPGATNLEGYLYPTTYEFDPSTTPNEAIRRMVGEFKSQWKPEWEVKARRLGLTNRQVVTIASLIENESKFERERPIVASVIFNRLERGMALGIDATNVYVAKLLGRWDGVLHKSDFEINHPYNTRKISGLPPGPISSASESALEAALNPAKTNYLYYVLNPERNDGSHDFFESAAEFERGKAKYQRWLAEQRRK